MVKYLEIYETIKQRILDLEYTSNEKLPDGKTLAKLFNCSELTIKKALDILVNNGFVVRKSGSGSFVKQQLGKSCFKHLQGSKANSDAIGKSIQTTVLNFSIDPANTDIAKHLNCQEGDMLYRISRIRVINGDTNILEDTYMLIMTIPGLTKRHTEESIYAYITKELKLKIHSSMMEITIIKANKFEADSLSINEGEHLVNVEQLGYLDNGEIFEYSNSKHLCDEFTFSTNIIRM